MRKRLWIMWARALGEKADARNDRYSDQVAWFRTFIIIQAIITNVLISINILVNWLK